MPTTSLPAALTLSIVSHGQGKLIRPLLEDIDRSIDVPARLIITLNIPEDEGFLKDHIGRENVIVLRNAHPKGFGANHNAAFAHCTTPFFAVVNPDIRSENMRLAGLLALLEDVTVAGCGPLILSPDGTLQDSARVFPSLWRIVRRVGRRLTGSAQQPVDYSWKTSSPVDVDWLAGMFIIFRSSSYAAVNGFDESYFMYLEDADLCRRLGKRGWRILLDPGTSLVHDAQRASHRNFQHLKWHISSLVRFLRQTSRTI